MTASFCLSDTPVKKHALAGEFKEVLVLVRVRGGYVILQGSLCVRPRQLKPQENSFLNRSASSELQSSE